jgi:hypothetical protein
MELADQMCAGLQNHAADFPSVTAAKRATLQEVFDNCRLVRIDQENAKDATSSREELSGRGTFAIRAITQKYISKASRIISAWNIEQRQPTQQAKVCPATPFQWFCRKLRIE